MKKIISGVAAAGAFVLAASAFAAGVNPPSNLSATGVSSSQINLSWTDNSGNETGFEIHRSLNGTDFSLIDTVGVNVTSYQNTGLNEYTRYYYKVRAYKVGGHSTTYSSFSNTANAWTLQNPPAAPSELSATAGWETVSSVQVSVIDLSWTDNATNENYFVIERGTDGVNFSYYGSVGPNVTTFRDWYVTSSVTYYYRVYAHNFGGDSSYSNVASATAL